MDITGRRFQELDLLDRAKEISLKYEALYTKDTATCDRAFLGWFTKVAFEGEGAPPQKAWEALESIAGNTPGSATINVPRFTAPKPPGLRDETPVRRPPMLYTMAAPAARSPPDHSSILTEQQGRGVKRYRAKSAGPLTLGEARPRAQHSNQAGNRVALNKVEEKIKNKVEIRPENKVEDKIEDKAGDDTDPEDLEEDEGQERQAKRRKLIYLL